MTPMQDQLVALAGLFQSAQLVHKLAQTGQISDASLEHMLNTLLVTSPQTTLDVYGGDDYALREGYRTLQAALLRDATICPGKACAMPCRCWVWSSSLPAVTTCCS